MGCLVGCLIGAVIGIILAPVVLIGLTVATAKAKKKARAIINEGVTTTPEEINEIIDAILKLNKSPKEEERDLVEKLREIKQNMEQS